MTRIRILPDKLVGQIAAGEVVERPASVVKELIENSLDAGAGEVKIDLEVGGKRRIRVVDDGSGMAQDDALLAFDRHATSKIESFADLERVETLGFRGEALATIAAVARVELRTAEAEGQGHRVRIEGGRIRSVEPVAHPKGTSIEVASLFFNVPARRKFLKSTQTELRRCLEVIQGYALAHPAIRFSASHNGRTLFEALPADPGPAGARRRIGQVFGGDLERNLAEIGPDGGEEQGSIWGFVGSPATARGRRLFVFVNRRLVRDRAVLATFYRAVREEWRSEDFPALFLFLDLPPETVDVNVHPQKAEVRFRDPAQLDRVSACLRRGLRQALGEGEAPAFHPDSLPDAPFASRGMASGADPGWRAADEVGEGFSRQGFSVGRLPQATVAPPERRPVGITGRSGETRAFRLLGQYKGTLILFEGPDGLYLIDQHVAHERILYERLRRELAAERPSSQRLLQPALLELAPAEDLRLRELVPALEGCGFELAELSGALGLSAVPAVLSADEGEKLLLALAADRREGPIDPAGLRQDLLDALAASLACRAAVKMHHPLSADEMESLVEELFAAESPYACPHGRPIVLRMSDGDLERRFGRS